MSLTLHSHPFASYCQKVLIALYENDTPFTAHLVDLGDEKARADHLALWPVGKMPVLRDAVSGQTIPESTIIIEYLASHYPGKMALVPADADHALQTRLRDRFYDLYVSDPMQKIVGDRLRPLGKDDPFGVQSARTQLRTSYDLIEREMATKAWATGDTFTMADCAAGPALFYADWVEPAGDSYPNVAAYLRRLTERPSFARVIEEALPYRGLFPKERTAG